MTPRVTPKTWAHEDLVTAALFNEQIRGNMNALWPYAQKGDIASAIGADELAPQSVGANGTVVTADAAQAAGVKWAMPAITKIAEVLLLAPALTVSFTDIPGAYRHLKLQVQARSDYVGDVIGYPSRAYFNGDYTTAQMYIHYPFLVRDSGPVGSAYAQAYIYFAKLPGSLNLANMAGQAELTVENYALTTFGKGFWYMAHDSENANTSEYFMSSGFWKSTAAITRIDIDLAQNYHFLAGSLFSLYGLS